jgi:hypothetical protein
MALRRTAAGSHPVVPPVAGPFGEVFLPVGSSVPGANAKSGSFAIRC